MVDHISMLYFIKEIWHLSSHTRERDEWYVFENDSLKKNYNCF